MTRMNERDAHALMSDTDHNGHDSMHEALERELELLDAERLWARRRKAGPVLGGWVGWAVGAGAALLTAAGVALMLWGAK